MEGRLFKILNLVIDWVKFGETKNALILAFQGGLAVGVFRASMDAKLTGAAVDLAWIGIVCLALGSIEALVSFFPKLRLVWPYKKPYAKNVGTNVIYFGYIAGLNVDSFLKEVTTSTGDSTEYQPNSIQWHIAEQVVVNSQIALWKFRVFSWALRATILGVVFLATAALLRLVGT